MIIIGIVHDLNVSARGSDLETTLRGINGIGAIHYADA